MAPSVVRIPADASGASARATTVARGRARAAHAVRPPRAPLRALRIRVRAPRGLRPADHFRQDHEEDPTCGRCVVRASQSTRQVPPAAVYAAGRA